MDHTSYGLFLPWCLRVMWIAQLHRITCVAQLSINLYLFLNLAGLTRSAHNDFKDPLFNLPVWSFMPFFFSFLFTMFFFSLIVLLCLKKTTNRNYTKPKMISWIRLKCEFINLIRRKCEFQTLVDFVSSEAIMSYISSWLTIMDFSCIWWIGIMWYVWAHEENVFVLTLQVVNYWIISF